MKPFLMNKIPSVGYPDINPAVENSFDEPLMYLNNFFDCDSQYNHWCEMNNKPLPCTSPYLAARESVVAKLKKAESYLPYGYAFRILDAYRPIQVQQTLWDYFKTQNIKRYPHKSELEIYNMTIQCVSEPSYNEFLPSLHNTGGAIDLTLVDTHGVELDMGCKFDSFADSSWTSFYEEKDYNDVARDNRRLLYNVMINAGFTNLPSEWWHFDYGDAKWAWFNNTKPIYKGLLTLTLKDSVPE